MINRKQQTAKLISEGFSINNLVNMSDSEISTLHKLFEGKTTYVDKLKTNDQEIAKMVKSGEKVIAIESEEIDEVDKSGSEKKFRNKSAQILASIDNLIALETKKLELLKQHKKGLKVVEKFKDEEVNEFQYWNLTPNSWKHFVPNSKDPYSKIWDDLTTTQREDVLLSAIKDPDDMQKYLDYDWDDLPSEVTQSIDMDLMDNGYYSKGKNKEVKEAATVVTTLKQPKLKKGEEILDEKQPTKFTKKEIKKRDEKMNSIPKKQFEKNYGKKKCDVKEEKEQNTERMSVQVSGLKKGDVLAGSKLEVVSVSSGARTPSGKYDVTVKNPKTGKTETKLWGKYTKVGILRHSDKKEERLITVKEHKTLITKSLKK